MRFYNRNNEIDILKQKSQQAKAGMSTLTLLLGRRRVGKTALLHHVYAAHPNTIYLFVSRKAESLLCAEFFEQIKMQWEIPDYATPTTLKALLQLLFAQARQYKGLTIIIDEFQDIKYVNNSFFSDMQNLWDQHRHQGHTHLICCGSVYSLMSRLFQDEKQPLFGRADCRIHLRELQPRYIAQLLKDNQQFSGDNLLLWYCLSGGIPKYLEWLAQIPKETNIWAHLIQENSLLIDEGHYRLAEEFGAQQPIYFSILALIACGKTNRSAIESVLQTSIGPYLEKLTDTYDIIDKIRPVLAKKNARQVKYFIKDALLSFWFRFIYSHQSAVEIGNYEHIRKIITRDYLSYAGTWLEQLHMRILAASGDYNVIGRYWESGNRNEIDIIALNEMEKKALICEVKINPGKINLTKLKEKSHKLVQNLSGYGITYQGLSISSLENVG